MKSRDIRPKRGFVLVSVLFLTLLAMLAVVGVLSQVRNNLAFEGSSKRLMVRDYENEVTLSKGIQWVNTNATAFAALLNASDFYILFDRTQASIGENDSSLYGVPTMVKLQGSNESFILTSTNSIGNLTVTPDNAAAAQLATNFQATFDSTELIRITLIDVVTEDPSHDQGDPETGGSGLSSAPYPLLRIDVFPKDQSATNTFALIRGKPAP